MFVRSCGALLACLGLVAGLGLAVPGTVSAQVVLGRSLCMQCRPFSPVCTCTTLSPVVETRVRAEPALTVRSEPRVGYRTEAQVTSTPVTTFRNVTVDEGHYQTVWVPRPVTRAVAETTWQPQVSYRSVPFVYNEPVAEWATRLVPEQTLRYVPQTQVVVGGPVLLPRPVVASTVVLSGPAIAASPLVVPGSSIAAAPIPDPAFAHSAARLPGSDWSTISSRSPAGPISHVSLPGGGYDYEVLPAQSLVPQSGFSVKAPSAAIVWQTPGTRRGR